MGGALKDGRYGLAGRRSAALRAEPQASRAKPAAANAELIERRLRELSVVICAHLGGGSEWFSRIGDDFYADPKAIGAELQRRKTDAQITKRALILANRRAAAESDAPNLLDHPSHDSSEVVIGGHSHEVTNER